LQSAEPPARLGRQDHGLTHLALAHLLGHVDGIALMDQDSR
jgi:hypothetical protein